jgi:hypothetical protein
VSAKDFSLIVQSKNIFTLHPFKGLKMLTNRAVKAALLDFSQKGNVMQVDWKKPVQVNVDGTWIDAEVLRVLDDTYAVLGRFVNHSKDPSNYSHRMMNNMSEHLRNTPEPPKLVPWTMEELLHHWNSAFRKKSNPSYILRMNINNHYIGVGGVTLSLEQLKEYYEVTATPWDVTSWKPCGKFE